MIIDFQIETSDTIKIKIKYFNNFFKFRFTVESTYKQLA